MFRAKIQKLLKEIIGIDTRVERPADPKNGDYSRTPQMNAHLERFNRSIQEEFVGFHAYLLINPDDFNQELIDYLIFYNIQRVHHAFQNKLSPIQFMVNWQKSQNIFLMPEKSKIGLHYTRG